MRRLVTDASLAHQFTGEDAFLHERREVDVQVERAALLLKHTTATGQVARPRYHSVSNGEFLEGIHAS